MRSKTAREATTISLRFGRETATVNDTVSSALPAVTGGDVKCEGGKARAFEQGLRHIRRPGPYPFMVYNLSSTAWPISRVPAVPPRSAS